MNTKSNLADVQENINLARGPASLRATLNNLAGYMTAASYNPDHPWCMEIAAALSAAEDADTAIDHALAAVNAADLGVSIINQLTTLIESIAAIAQVDAADPIAMGRQVATIRRLAKHAHHFAADQAESYSCDRDDLVDALAALKGGAQ